MLDEKMNSEQVQELADAMLTLQDREEALLFFEDIFTIKELQAVAQRLALPGAGGPEAALGGKEDSDSELEITDVSGCSSDSDGDEGLPVPPKAKAGKGGVGS